MEYTVFYRIMRDGRDYWCRSPRYNEGARNEALKKYAMCIKEYGMDNVIFAQIPEMTCVSVEVLYDGQTENSQ